MKAPFENGAWIPALAATARATGSRTAALSGMNVVTGALAVHLMPDKPENIERDYLAYGGTDPRRNLLLRRALLTPVMRHATDVEAVSRDARRHDPLWNEFYVKYGFHHSCICPLWRQGKRGIALNLRRSSKQGPITEGERKMLVRLSQYWRSAIMLTRTLQTDSATLLGAGFDTLYVAVIVIDGFGSIIAMTQAAEKIVRSGALLRVEQGRLAATARSHRVELELAVNSSLDNWPQLGRPAEFVLPGAMGTQARIHISPLPHHNGIGFGATALVVIENMSGEGALLDSLRLTAAESAVAAAVISGLSVRSIAHRREVSYETVRSQLKSIYAKAGVASRAEFMAKRHN